MRVFVTYKKIIILKSLLLAPLPFLVIVAFLFIVINNEFKLNSILTVVAVHLFVYLVYCVLTVPFSFLFSVILNRYQYLNFFSICLSSLLIAAPFLILLSWAHTGQVTQRWWLIYQDGFSLFFALIPAVCYWLILINLKPHQPDHLDL
nr:MULTISPECIES: hypothetical protein [unclassified Acinetobacter]